MASGFSFDTSHFKGAKDLDRKIERALFGVCKLWDGKVEAHMKHQAPWTDRTSNARNGLAARAAKLGKSTFGIILSHAVDYGIYLERGHDQETKRGVIHVEARPIINPTIDLFAPRVIAFTTDLMDRL